MRAHVASDVTSELAMQCRPARSARSISVMLAHVHVAGTDHRSCVLYLVGDPSIVQGSSRVFRSNRPPASLQQLWTWSCSLTEGRPVSSMAWNSSNNNLMAAGYGTRPSADSAQAAGAAGGSGFAQGQQGSIVGQGALLSAPRPAAGDAAAGDSSDGAAAADADGAGGCVALWSLKNQFYPVWSFKTKAGELWQHVYKPALLFPYHCAYKERESGAAVHQSHVSVHRE